jgi:transcription elongation factor GreA
MQDVFFFFIQNCKNMAEVVYVTREGLEKMNQELHELVSIERPKASAAIAEAREKGDLSENAEYDAAKEAQGLLELRISKLQGAIGSARVLDPSQLDTSKVSVLCKVRVLNLKVNKEFNYSLVSENEADLKQMKISVKSPIGSALLGKVVGDVVTVQAPGGSMDIKILEISL